MNVQKSKRSRYGCGEPRTSVRADVRTPICAAGIHGRIVFTGVVILALLVGFVGCGERKSSLPMDESAVTRTAKADDVSLTFTITATDLNFEQPTEIVLEASAPAGKELGASIVIDHYLELLADKGLGFELRVVQTEAVVAAKQADGRLSWTYRYRVQFVLPGEYELPGARLTYILPNTGDNEGTTHVDTSDSTESDGNDQGARTRTLTTQPIKVIARDPSNRQLSDEELATIQVLEPVELPPRVSLWWWVIGAVAVAVVALVMLRKRLLRKWRARQAAHAARVVIVPAHEWARKRIAELIAERLLERRSFQEFHYRVSYIVRGYIERRYGVTAAEMTTEEFLAAAIQDRRFGAETTSYLQRFLEACDLVKYARHEPTTDDSQDMIATAESFIQRTRVDEQGNIASAASTTDSGAQEQAA